MNIPAPLHPFISLGTDLTMRGNHGIGDCPFCMGEGKLSVDATNGLWRCFVCGSGSGKGGGNALTFARLVYERSSAQEAATTAPATSRSAGTPSAHRPMNAALIAVGPLRAIAPAAAADRRLARPATVVAWGVCQSIIPPHRWLVPGYNTEGKLMQVYSRTHVLDRGEWRWLLLPVKELWEEGKAHALHMPVQDFNRKRPELVICEGPWDGMAMWEVQHPALREANVIAVPGCNVWRDEWTEMCRDKTVTLMYDNDHPRVEGDKTFRPGYDGMVRVARRISRVAHKVRWLRWGEEGWDATKPDGWDVRDELSGKTGKPALMVDRRAALDGLLLKVADAPKEWAEQPIASGRTDRAVEPKPCHSWEQCESAWKLAMRWRRTMSDALSVVLAVCASTQQGGKSQLFVQLVGSPGGGKTSILDGALVSKHCHSLDHLTGFFSGWKKPGEEEKDCSLLARINGKTLITCEADVIMSDPKFDELMSQQRRIFDGKSSSTYKNSDQDKHYDGLRTPWIMGGTQAMLTAEGRQQAHLGDRFIRFIIDDPKEDEEREIMRAALRSERAAMMQRSDGTAASLLDPKTLTALSLTGGYVDWLRANAESLLEKIDANFSPEIEEQCLDLATMTSYLRARPNEDKRRIVHHEGKEVPTRLAQQYIRLAECLAAVLNKESIDEDVMRVVLKVSLDTAHGPSLKAMNFLCSQNYNMSESATFQETTGVPTRTMCAWIDMTEEKGTNYLSFMRRLGILSLKRTGHHEDSWFLTERIYDLYLKIRGITRAEQ